MKEYNPKELLISLHIQKCGGSSFNEVIRKWFGLGFHHHKINELTDKLPSPIGFKKKLAPILPLCVHGHFAISRGCSADLYYPEASQFITIVRDPLELHLSNYFYIAQAIKDNGGFWISGKKHLTHPLGESIDQCLEEYKNIAYEDNLHFKINESNYMSVLNQNFIHIGITEDLQKSVDIIAEKLRKKSITIPHINKAERMEKPSESSIKIFKEKHKFEYLIFDFACSINK
jgi:hypothetical protein